MTETSPVDAAAAVVMVVDHGCDDAGCDDYYGWQATQS